MSHEAELTIIIPVHNREALVERTLQSVEAQTLRPLHVVVVDNNSTDGSAQVIARWKARVENAGFRVSAVSEPHPGAAAARNRGLEETTSEFVMFFDSDDTMAPTHAEKALNALKGPGKPDMVGWDVTLHHLDGTTARKPFYAGDALWHCVMHGSTGTQRWAARSELVRRAGGWNRDIMGWNDIELGCRMLLTRPAIIKTEDKEPTVDIYSQEQSITGTDFVSGAAKWERSLDAIEASMPGRRLKRYANLRRALLAGDYARERAREESDRLLSVALSKEKCPFHRMLLRFARRYVACGLRGCARLMRPFF